MLIEKCGHAPPFEKPEETVKIFLTRLFEWRSAVDASVVDQEIKTFPLPALFKRLLNRPGEAVELADIREINLQKSGLAAELFNLRDGGFTLPLLLPVCKNYIGAVTGKGEGDIATQSPAAPGD